MQNKTHFGFQSVDEQEKASLVKGVFDSVASRYDVMNDLMSAGLHRLWKKEFVAWMNPQTGMNMLDVAGGTGDIAQRVRARANVHVTIMDINEAMLSQGRDRAIDRNQDQQFTWLCGNAESIPLPDACMDIYSIAFGIRNVTHIDKALAEAYRVLKVGGRFMCLEFSQLNQDWMQKLYDAYSFSVIPTLGRMVTGDRDSYQYLVESIRQFPNQERFADMIRQAGFGNVQYRSLTQGVVAIHSARKL
ncbi:MAG: bifunctional demethylmenaquinone methyltransferase/2-methoxy-6-polyprenyl-1,4-benzoquinol methylase UbiE [Rickettsiales bacterium]|nr:bifunctional demethylmenaquinone methyltransferase/2-methoxy-6-polyprenyl-1,4-benzoquinol methylase UbiE [Rickettsiales bacterium]